MSPKLIAAKALTAGERTAARRFLKVFSASDFNPYTRSPLPTDLGCMPYTKAVVEFITLLAEEKIGISAAIDDPATRLYKNPALIPQASPIEVRKMLYAMTRGERFCDGVFRTALTNGTIAAALKRILEADETRSPQTRSAA